MQKQGVDSFHSLYVVKNVGVNLRSEPIVPIARQRRLNALHLSAKRALIFEQPRVQRDGVLAPVRNEGHFALVLCVSDDGHPFIRQLRAHLMLSTSKALLSS